MTDKEFKIKKSTLEGIACMVVCFLIGYGYVLVKSYKGKNTRPEEN